MSALAFLDELAGGALIGLAASLVLVKTGKVTGVSGIAAGALGAPGTDRSWNLWFLAGLLASGVALSLLDREAIGAPRSLPVLILAGLLVGFGTRLGSGCTSGHGVCGVSRLSPRSVIATAVFVASGMATVWITG